MDANFFAFFAVPALGILFFGFLLGVKHATDADHIAAVSTIVSQRRGLWSSALVGGMWGLGHTISVVAAGILVLLLNFQITEKMETVLEIGVGIMLIFLGLNVARKLFNGGEIHFHKHVHGGLAHVHPHLHGDSSIDHADTHHGLSLSPRAMFIGMAHGLAGSAALMLVVIPTTGSRITGLLYVAAFGLGSILGMTLMSFIVGLPFHLTTSKLTRFNRLLQGASATLSIVLGAWIVYEKGFAGRIPG